jgi:hypothetical protein
MTRARHESQDGACAPRPINPSYSHVRIAENEVES